MFLCRAGFCEAFGKGDHRCLGGGVVRGNDNAAAPSGLGREVDDTAPALFFHDGKRFAADKEKPFNVDVKRKVLLFSGNVVKSSLA